MERPTTVVMKFGGSSLKDPSALERIARHISLRYQAGQGVVVVVSAPGNMTDSLLSKAREIQSQPDERSLAFLLATGEQQSCALVALKLNALNIPAVPMAGWQAGIRTDGKSFVDGRIVGIDTTSIRTHLQAGHVVVVAGFQGLFARDGILGEIVVLERGGSDTTAIHLACALDVNECILFKDVDGIAAAPPNMVPGAAILGTLSLEELSEMTRGGAEVVSETALKMLGSANVKLSVRPTFPDGSGTFVTLTAQHERTVSSVTFRSDVALITVEIQGEHTDTQLLAVLAKERISVDLAEGNHLTIRSTDAERVSALLSREQEALGIQEFAVCMGLAQITVVGEGMRHTPGILGRIQEVLQNKGIPWFLRSTSEITASYVVSEDDCPRAVAELYYHFFSEAATSSS